MLPLLPMILMVFGHETWRRVCPLSHFSQIPHMLGWQRQVKRLNRTPAKSSAIFALLPSDSWLQANHYYFQFGFLDFGFTGRILFYNSDRLALVFGFVFIHDFRTGCWIIYGGKTWCNYFCPISVIQDMYTGAGGLLDLKVTLLLPLQPAGRYAVLPPN